MIEDNNLSLKEIGSTLNLGEPQDRFVKGAQVQGCSIFNQNNDYCFGVFGAVECVPVDWGSEIKVEEDCIYEYESIPINQTMDMLGTPP